MRASSMWDAGAEDMQRCFKNRSQNHRAARRGASRREPRAPQHQSLPCRTTTEHGRDTCTNLSIRPQKQHSLLVEPRWTWADPGLLLRRLEPLGSVVAEKRNTVAREPGYHETTLPMQPHRLPFLRAVTSSD